MAFCTRCGQQTEGGQRTPGGAELCLFCGELASGPEVHHGYPGRRASRHAGPGDVYARQEGAANPDRAGRYDSAGGYVSAGGYDSAGAGRSACRVPLSDYPSLTDLPAVADTWPTASYSSRHRAIRQAFPPDLALLRYPAVTPGLTVRPGPPEFESEQQDDHDQAGAESDLGRKSQAGTARQPLAPVLAAAHRARTAARSYRGVSAAAAGLVLAVGTATVAIALADHSPQAPGQNVAGGLRLGVAGAGGRTSSAPADGSGAGPIAMVRAGSAVAAGPREARVLLVLDRYFGAINAHDFAAYQKLFRPALRPSLSQAAFTARYGTTTDAREVLHGIIPAGHRIVALVTFTSHKRSGPGPAGTSCTDWSVRLYLRREGHHYVVAKPPADYQPTRHSCP